MRIVLTGQRSFGRAVLEMLLGRGDDVAAVYAPPGDKLALLADLRRLDVRPAGTLRARDLPARTDLIVAAHSHDFVSRPARLAVKYGAIGYHPSLLPLHRGRDAVRWTIRDGDRVAGGTVFWLSDTVDGGPVAKHDWCLVRPGDTAQELWHRELFPMGLRLLAATLDDVAKGRVVRVPQDPECATWEPSFEGAPRLFRAELPLLGDAGYRVVMDREATRDR